MAMLSLAKLRQLCVGACTMVLPFWNVNFFSSLYKNCNKEFNELSSMILFFFSFFSVRYLKFCYFSDESLDGWWVKSSKRADVLPIFQVQNVITLCATRKYPVNYTPNYSANTILVHDVFKRHCSFFFIFQWSLFFYPLLSR